MYTPPPPHSIPPRTIHEVLELLCDHILRRAALPPSAGIHELVASSLVPSFLTLKKQYNFWSGVHADRGRLRLRMKKITS